MKKSQCFFITALCLAKNPSLPYLKQTEVNMLLSDVPHNASQCGLTTEPLDEVQEMVFFYDALKLHSPYPMSPDAPTQCRKGILDSFLGV